MTEIFKAYDIRGVYPDQFDESIARRIGVAFAKFSRAQEIAVGRDMRSSSEPLCQSFIDGVVSQGVDVIDLGLASTDLVYYAAGSRRLFAAMFTASHNPAEYNGIKLCGPGATPIGRDTGLETIRELSLQKPASSETVSDTSGGAASSPRKGHVTSANLLDEFATHLLNAANNPDLSGLKIAVDAANGMGGLVVPAVLGQTGVEIVDLYFDLDGTFPNHPADPIQEANLIDLKRTLERESCDAGLAFDGDADRVFFVDENGLGVSGSLTTAVIADEILKSAPKGQSVVYNVICSRVVTETIQAHGAKAVRSRVGHSFIKALMAEHDAIFGGEHSGHYYFQSNFRADSGLLAALWVLGAMAQNHAPLSKIVQPFRRYVESGEINSVVDDQTAAMKKVAKVFERYDQDNLDGLTVEAPDWWFNLRPSNTEPLLRLNVEASDEPTMNEMRKQVLDLMAT